MSIMDVDVSRFSLSVDARDTVRAVLDSGDSERGAKLDRALQLATVAAATRDAAFAVPPFVRVRSEDVCPGPDVEDAWPDVADRDESRVLAHLERAGLVETFDVFSEGIGESYLSEGRVMTGVRVLRPFCIVHVEYRRSRGNMFGYPDRWEIAERTRVIGTGTYLVGMVGDFSLSYVGATGIDTARDGETGVTEDVLFYWMTDQEGFLASSCLADCDTCGGRWTAEAGSWHFRPDYGSDVAAFDFDATDDADGATIACPDCGTGRVGFLII